MFVTVFVVLMLYVNYTSVIVRSMYLLMAASFIAWLWVTSNENNKAVLFLSRLVTLTGNYVEPEVRTPGSELAKCTCSAHFVPIPVPGTKAKKKCFVYPGFYRNERQ
jgi:hypothetical protein